MTNHRPIQGVVRVLRDLTTPSDNPFIETIANNGDSIIVAVTYRVIRKGSMYRTEWMDGTPRRLFDGSTVWDYPADDPRREIVRINDGAIRNPRPFLIDIPPLPGVPERPDLKPLLSDTIQHPEIGTTLRTIYPIDTQDLRPGYTFLVDPCSGWVRRQWHASKPQLLTSWSRIDDVSTVPDHAFSPGLAHFERARLEV